ncbi:hypothetical protein SNE40_001280 [Patella caerulea]|uniref:poly(ADP-ribose) glycohydrolase n=1 Tax=Patella caerulea TaxID=87958 RepID=A0AAN8KE92_PATCE
MTQANGVILPCQLPTWTQVKRALANLKEKCLTETTTVEEITTLLNSLFEISATTGSDKDLPWHKRNSKSGATKHGHSYVWFGFSQFLGMIDAEDRNRIIHQTLPSIIQLAMDIDTFPSTGVQQCSQQNESTTVLARSFIASILACGFLCLYQPRHRSGKLNEINFTSFLKNLYLPVQMAKLRCVLNYFDRITSSEEERKGAVTYTRKVIEKSRLPTMEDYLSSDQTLCPITIHHKGCIEDIGSSSMEVDFANKYIGGGSLGKGAVQEEIRFMACPELIASQLFMECMDDNEAIIISGYKQYSKHSGYAQSFSYDGNYDQPVEGENTMCCIDATTFRNKVRRIQFTERYILRELNKALLGFTGQSSINQQECAEKLNLKDGVSSDEEFLTAFETSDEDSSPRYISEYASKMLNGLLSQATREAVEKSKSQKKAKHVKREDLMMAAGNLTSKPDVRISETTGHIIVGATDQINIQNNYLAANVFEGLDVDYGDWLNNFRRRSSNLSDITSRRSSTSTKHSSEISSDLDDLYESYIRSEKSKHGTIQEESYETISDFAAKLISCLMQEGTSKAASMLPCVQDFDECPPLTAIKPKPSKDTVQNGDNSLKQMAETVADKTFKSVVTFAMLEAVSIIASKNSQPDNTSNNNSHSSTKTDAIPDTVYEWFADHIVSDAFVQASEEYSHTDIMVDNVINHTHLDPNVSHESGSSGDSSAPRLSFSSAPDDNDHNASLLSGYDSSNSSVASEKKPCALTKKRPSVKSERDRIFSCKSSISEGMASTSDINLVENICINHGHSAVNIDTDVNLNEAAARIVRQVFMGIPERLEEESAAMLSHTPLDHSVKFEESTVELDKNRSKDQTHTVTFADDKSGPLPWSNFSKREEKNRKYDTSNVGILTKKLSRETLTNAYLKAENRRQTKSYERRSSEPCHISVERSLQALDNEKAACDMDKRNRKISRTDEDFDRFKADSQRRGSWDIMPSGRRRSSCGFKDPVLSRFAEELMKADTSIPPLQIAQRPNSSTSGSRRSSVSAFKDVTLAFFDMELLGSSFEAPSSPRHNSTRKCSRDSKLVKSDSSEADYAWFPLPRRVGVEFQENYERLHNYHSVDEIEDFADMIAQNVLQEAVDILNREQELNEEDQFYNHVEYYADQLSQHVLDMAFSVIKKHKKDLHLLSDSNRKNVLLVDAQNDSIDDFHDALDIEIQVLEKYADNMVATWIKDVMTKLYRPKHRLDEFICKDKPISSGNWGCGAFCGDPHIKSLLQWMAASIVQTPVLHYFIFDDPRLVRLEEVVKFIEDKKWRVGDIMKAIKQYCDIIFLEDGGYNDDDFTISFTLFDFILTL